MSNAAVAEQPAAPTKSKAELINAARVGDLSSAIEGLLDEQDAPPVADDSAPPREETKQLDELPTEIGEEESGEVDESDLSQSESTDESDSEEAAEPEEDENLVRPDDPHGVKKRIGKLSQKIQDAEQRAEAYKAELESLRETADNQDSVSPIPSANRYDSVATVEELSQKQSEARELVKFCDKKLRECVRRGLDEVEELVGDRNVKFTVERLEEIRDNAQDALDQDIPARREFLTTRQRVLPEAHRLFPFFKDRSSAEYQEAMGVVRTMPEVKRYPDWELKVGVYVEGLKAIRAKAAAAKKPKAAPTKRAPAQPTQPSAAPAKTDPKVAKVTKARDRFRQRMDRDALASLIETVDF